MYDSQENEDVCPAIAPKETQPLGDIDAALAWHDGDARATIETLLADCRHLREQLALASGAMSRGMTRGWMPSLDRE